LIIINEHQNQHIRVILCDTEHWSNDAGNTALPLHEQTTLKNISQLKPIV